MDKVIIAKATDANIDRLQRIVRNFNANTNIKAFPSCDNEAVFFPIDEHDSKFVEEILTDNGFEVRTENAE